MTDRKVRRGEIYYADLPETESGSVQAGRRPVLITQCDRLNRTSTTVLVAIVTSKLKRPDDETHVVLPMMKGLPKQSMVEAEQRKNLETARKMIVFIHKDGIKKAIKSRTYITVGTCFSEVADYGV